MASTNRVLVYRLGSLGDHLVAVPAYRLVRRVFPEAEVRLLTNIPVQGKAAAAEAVLNGSGLVDGYMSYVLGERGVLPLLKLWWSILRWRPEVLVYLAGARGVKAAKRDATFFRLCGIKRLIGLPDTEEMQQNLPRSRRLLGAMETIWFEQEGERLARCIAELGDAETSNPTRWQPGLTAEERTQAADLLQMLASKPFFALSLGTKAQSNHWGVDNWKALAGRVSQEFPEHALVLLGAPEERAECDIVGAAWGGPVLNLCGASSPRVSGAVMERAALFLGHDSGPAHMAAAVGTRTVGIFSARMPAGTWVPHGEHVHVVLHWVECGGCLLQTCIEQQKKCILSIGVDEAMNVVRQHMKGSIDDSRSA